MEKNNLIININDIKNKFDKIASLIVNPDIISDVKRYINLSKKYKELEKIIFFYKKYLNQKKIIKEADYLLSSEEDTEMRELIYTEKSIALNKLLLYKKNINLLLMPKDKNDNKNAILEIRAGTGGDEACLFVENIMRMYVMYFKIVNWNFDIINLHSGNNSGYKEVIIKVIGNDVYGTLKFESGVHRVQRIPKTESQGRLHTSAITIAVLPEAGDLDIKINQSDIKRSTFKSSGAGGQHVNKTESAVRLVHIPTGITVECQDERSQHKNLDKAMSVLRSRVYQLEQERVLEKRSYERRSLIKTGDRSAKIRTYNYPQGRVTDHRINKSIYYLEEFLNGEIQEMIDALKIVESKEMTNKNL